MRLELKRKIIEWIFEHINEWQIVNRCVDAFREYIYDKDGYYLIGGKDVSDFIDDEITLITKQLN